MKKVITIVSLSLIGLLILATIIMACVPVCNNPNFNTPDGITIYSSKLPVARRDYDKEDKAFQDIISQLKKAPKQQALSALFNGTISQDVDLVKLSSTESYTSITNSDETVVKFKITYAEGNEQTMKYEDEEFTYNAMLYILNKDAGRTQTTVYLLKDGRANYTLNYYGNFDNVFETVSSLISENI